MENALHSITWFQVMTAVLFANGLTLIFIYAGSFIARHEKKTGSSFGAPMWVYISLAVPPGLAALGAFFLKV